MVASRSSTRTSLLLRLSRISGLNPAADRATQVWLPPQDDYPVIAQNAVLLKVGQDNQAAKDFLDYLKSDEAVAVIKAAGYETK